MRASSIGWNLGGLVLPLVVAVVAIPLLVERLGSERFGLLSLAWALTAMSGMLDLGIGRATTQEVAQRLGQGSPMAVGPTCASAVIMTAASGALGGLLFAGAVVGGLPSLVRFDPRLSSEVTTAAFLLAAALPAQALIATFRGIAEAFQSFGGINVLRILLGVANFGGPLLLSQFTLDLGAMVGVLLGARLVALIGFFMLAQRQLRQAGIVQLRWDGTTARRLTRSGGWLTVSASISPLLATADRFLLGSWVSAAAITVYVVPYELVMQPLVLVSAIATVAYPTIARSLAENSRAAQRQELRWLVGGSALMALAAVVLVFVVEDLLRLWLHRQPESASVQVAHWLCLGMWLNAVGQLLTASIHARAAFRQTAVLHLVEVVLYLGALAVVIPAYGVIGAAVAWSVRALFDTSGLILILGRLMRPSTLVASPSPRRDTSDTP